MFNGMNGLEILKNWPRFDDGEPVEFGDEFQNAHGGASVLRTAIIKDCRDSLGGDFYWKLGKGKNAVTLKSGERVKRPAPKVLDADGVEIRVGDTVWNSVGAAFTVCAVNGDKSSFDAVRGYDEQKCPGLNPAIFTHRAPVLAADGKPLEVGQTVFGTNSGEEYQIKGFSKLLGEPCVVVEKNGIENRLFASQLTHQRTVLDADGKPLREGETVWDTNGDELIIGAIEDGGHTVACRYVDIGDAIPVHGMWSPSDLTHERPDSWERLEKDANAAVCVYFGANLKSCDNCDHNSWKCSYDKARDLVRRCKALAERGQ